ncbi:MAG TPA: vWA domain-containing protein [Polyangiaceae bacterium]|nr:vWA domain-containing protein [Polyangiaceae bacterium]
MHPRWLVLSVPVLAPALSACARAAPDPAPPPRLALAVVSPTASSPAAAWPAAAESIAASPAAPPPSTLPIAAAPLAPTAFAAAAAPIAAGEWDDNANYREFQQWLRTSERLPFHRVDVSQRRFLVVRDVDGRPVPRCPVTVFDREQRRTTLTTAASGRAVLFPRAEGLRGDELRATARCERSTAAADFSLAAGDGVVDLRLSTARDLPARPAIDVAFVLDTTGSMDEEIAAVKSTIRAVSRSLEHGSVDVRIGMVAYKDRGDEYVTRVYPMTTDLAAFGREVADVSASGGGDVPESVNEAVHVALTRLEWDPGAVGRYAFLVGDAPPHLDYAQDFDYAADARDAAHRGIQVFTIAASGMDGLGQVVWRQIAQYTGARNLFVLRGGAGPQSTGAGDPRSSCGGTQTRYTSDNLDGLILADIARELKALSGDPLRIAGLDRDEDAKPCAERLIATD